MGKRKKSGRAPAGPKKREPLSTTFQCLFCNHENSVSVKLHKKEGVGQLDCRICGQTFSSNINYLSAAVDVYSDWIDACEAVQANPDLGVATVRSTQEEFQPPRRSEPATRVPGGEEDDLDDFIEDDEGDMDAGYAG